MYAFVLSLTSQALSQNATGGAKIMSNRGKENARGHSAVPVRSAHQVTQTHYAVAAAYYHLLTAQLLSQHAKSGAIIMRNCGKINARGRGRAMPVKSAAPVRYCYRASSMKCVLQDGV